MRKRWKTAVTALTVAVMGLSVVAAAYGVTRTTRAANGRGACAALMSNPQAVKDMQALRIEHEKDMQAWWDKYGSDPSSAAARAALRTLRQEHWNDMLQLFKKYGIAVPESAGPGVCGGGMMGGGMMGGGSGPCGGAGAAGCAGPGSVGSTGGTSYGGGLGGGGSGMMGGSSY